MSQSSSTYDPGRLKGKRKKKIPPPHSANPLFMKWLTEWRDEAKEKKLQSVHTYSKAIKTLKRFPLPLETGKDCRLLQNFGEKTCKMLDEKLAEYRLQQASEESTRVREERSPSPVVPVVHPGPSHSRGGRSSHVTTTRPSERPPPIRPRPHCVSDSSGEEEVGTPAKKRQRSGPGEYVPIERSGPYAILVTLYNYMQDNQFVGYLSKSDLIGAAQPLCDTSFLVPKADSWYTAWSSMATLLKKGLINKWSSPAKFSLTTSGYDLAERLVTVDQIDRAELCDTETHMDHMSSTTHMDASTSASPNTSARTASTTDSPSRRKTSTPSAKNTRKKDPAAPAKKPRKKKSVPASIPETVPHVPHGCVEDFETHQSEMSSARQEERMESLDNESEDFFPKFRSAPYALLVTLFKEIQKSGINSSMTESQLCREAQPLCDQLFVKFVNDKSGDLFVSSALENLVMKLLLSKTCSVDDITGAITRSFRLTDAGYDLAERLILADLERETNVDEADGSILMNDSWSCDPHTPVKPAATCERLRLPSLDSDRGVPDIGVPDIGVPDIGVPDRGAETSGSKSLTGNVGTGSKNPWSDSEDEDLPDECPLNSDVVVLDDDSDSNGAADCNKKTAESSSTGFTPHPVLRLHAFSPGGDDECFAVDDCESDNKTVTPVVPSRKPHSISPTQSSLMPRKSSPQKQKVSNFDFSFESLPDLPCDGNLGTSFSPQQNLSFSCDVIDKAESVKDGGNVLEISDDDVCLDSDKKVEAVVKNPCSDSEEDDLPDLFVPLSKRLLMAGKVKSSLLSSLPSSPVKQTVVLHDIDDYNVTLERRTEELLAICDNIVPSTSASSSGTAISVGKKQSVKSKTAKTTKKSQTSKEVEQPNNFTHLNSYSSILPAASSSSSVVSGTTRTADTPSVPLDLTPEFTFTPGTFDIILCIDNREFYGKKNSTKMLLPELMKCGVHCDLRHLHVGDLLWLARERGQDGMTGRPCGREMVLNYIVERKRMDDLVSSMTDGRMKEQKFRMKQCGISDCIIMIEEHGSIQNFSLSEQAIRQSIANSQIIDGFKMKRCRSSSDAVTYLACMTRSLQRQFCNKTLHAVSADQIRQIGKRQNLHDTTHYLMNFPTFNEASVKQKGPSVYELFAKQLIQVPGIRMEKARAITSLYPTMSLLLKAYSRCSTDKERESLVSKVKCGKTERAMGMAVSRLLALLYTEHGPLR